MHFFHRKRIIYYLILSVLIFFSVPNNEVRAAKFACHNQLDNGCTDVEANTYEEARNICWNPDATERVSCSGLVAYGCPDRRDGGCRDILVDPGADSFEQVRDQQCLTGTLMKKPCFVGQIPAPISEPNKYGCLIEYGRKCVDVEGITYNQAVGRCRALEPNAPDPFPVSCSGLAVYGCPDRRNGGCSSMLVDPMVTSFEQARDVKCLTGTLMKKPCFGFVPILPASRPPAPDLVADFGCMHDLACTNFKDTYEGARQSCLRLCGGNPSCQPMSTQCIEQDFFCVNNTVCQPVKAYSFAGAEELCMDKCFGCKASTDDCSKTSPNVTPNAPEKPNPLAGTSIEELKEAASQQLNPGNLTTPQNFISRAINLMTAFIGSIALALYVMAGLLWMTASGNEERVGKAKQVLVWTTLGVAVMLASYMLITMVFGFIPK